MRSKLAVQMYTLRDYLKTADGLGESLERISSMGYQAVQLSAVGAMDGESPAVSVKLARRMLDDNGLRCVATHRSWETLSQETEAEIAFHKELDCDYVAIGGMPGPWGQQEAADFTRFLKESAPVIARLKAAGIRFGYHNHDLEFRRTGQGRQTLLDIFIDEGGPDFTLEIDTYWAIHAGADPVDLINRCKGRIPVIHLKDKEVVKNEGPIMAAIGEGNLNWDSILPACKSAGVEWYAIEQDTCPRDPFDCLRSSFEFLKERDL